jgi:hypothetical protein
LITSRGAMAKRETRPASPPATTTCAWVPSSRSCGTMRAGAASIRCGDCNYETIEVKTRAGVFFWVLMFFWCFVEAVDW